jgi:hypothetical protein
VDKFYNFKRKLFFNKMFFVTNFTLFFFFFFDISTQDRQGRFELVTTVLLNVIPAD